MVLHAVRDLRQALGRILGKAPENPVLAANHAHFVRLDPETPLEQLTFAVLDTELTGLNPRDDEIVSIGAVRVRGMAIQAQDSFSSLVQPRRGVPKSATLIHGITPQQLEDAPRLRAILPELVDWLGGSLVVGHHVELDLGFLNPAVCDVFGAPLANPHLDTLLLARLYHAQTTRDAVEREAGHTRFALADLAAVYHLPRFPEHEALSDALQTAYLFLYLVRKLSGGGIRTLKDLQQADRNWKWFL